MRRVPLLLFLLFLLIAGPARAVQAQADTPPTPTGPLGEIRGTVINRNRGKAVAESLEVMLHVLDLNYSDLDMVHGQSESDGTFVFVDVPFDANLQFAVMATFDGVTYYSDVVPADMQSLKLDLDVPVYETTKDLSNVQVDQMHILFNISPDGLETNEVYILSNLGERTVKDVYDLGNNRFATLQFPLPEDADYIFFKPDDEDRFVKINGAFADTYPILPGNQPTQVTTSYLVPYNGTREYTYTAPVNTTQINFLVPDQVGVSLKGSSLTGPKSMILQNGVAYQIFSYSGLNAGDTLTVTVTGTSGTPPNTQKISNWPAMIIAFLGLGILGAGIWWWRKSETAPDEEDKKNDEFGEQTLDELIAEIARLDERYEQQGLSTEEHQSQRQELMQKAKHLL